VLPTTSQKSTVIVATLINGILPFDTRPY